jgi:hypothetical protein
VGYDAWKQTDPADETLGRSRGQAEPFACLECPWRGNGYTERSKHWYRTKHRIVWACDPRAERQAQERKAV